MLKSFELVLVCTENVSIWHFLWSPGSWQLQLLLLYVQSISIKTHLNCPLRWTHFYILISLSGYFKLISL